MVDEPAPDVHDAVWRALSDPTRRQLLDLLADGPRTTGQLAAAFPVSRFAVMKHLSALEAAGLVVVRRSGRERWNHLNGVPLREAYERFMRPHADRWAGSLLRLKRHAEQSHEEDAMHALTTAPLDIVQEVVIDAPPERVYAALTEETGAWWNHRFDEEGTVALEPTVGGRFHEQWPGGGALYATVTLVRPNRTLAMRGPMGMSGPVLGVIEYDLEPEGDGTRLAIRHKATGEVGPEQVTGYTEGWGALGERLRRYVETGAADAA